MNLRSLAAVLLVVLLLFGCRATGPVTVRVSESPFVPYDSLVLQSPARAVGRDGDGLVVLEASGTRLLRFVPGEPGVDTIPLSRRLAAPAGVMADRYYFYLYDESVLYRASKRDLEMKSWLNNVRVAGLAGYAPGEALVADRERGVVWLKTLFGESREFFTAGEINRPGPLAALGDGVFRLLAGPNILYDFDRAGIVDRRTELPGEYDLMAVDGQGRSYLFRRAVPHVLLAGPGRPVLHRLDGCQDPVSVAIVGDLLAVLDGESRITFYRLP